MRPHRLALGIAFGLAAAVATAPAGAATPKVRLGAPATHTVSAGIPAFRACHERLALVGDSVDRFTIAAPAAGSLALTMNEGRLSDWDLAVFDATTGRSLAGGASFTSDEVVTTSVAAGQLLTVQACRISGEQSVARVTSRFAAFQAPQLRGTLQTIRVFTTGRTAPDRLEALGVDVTHSVGPGWIDIGAVAPRDITRLRRAGFNRLKVLVADVVAAQRRAEARNAAWSASVGGRSTLPSGRTTYRSLADIGTDMKKIVAAYPTMARPVLMPFKSLEGRSIEGVEIAANVQAQDGRPIFLQDGTHHAREWPSDEMPLEFAFDAIQSYGKDPLFTKLLNESRLVTIPVINADGFVFTQSAPASVDNATNGPVEQVIGFGEFRRKNCRIFGTTADSQPPGVCALADGVDNNRNYNPWGGVGASSYSAGQTYRGSAPYSEPESRNARAYWLTRPVIGYITNHTNGKLILRPPGQKALGFAPDEATLKALGDAMQADTGYVSQYGWQLYDTSGTSRDAFYYATGSYIYTFEHGAEGFHGTYKNDVEGLYYGLAKYAGRGVRRAYLRMWEKVLDPVSHGIITGHAAPGAVIRLSKTIQLKTADPYYLVADDTGGQYAAPQPGFVTDEKYNMSLVVPADGRFEFHTYASTPPFFKQQFTWKVTCEDGSGKVLDSADLSIDRGQTKNLDMCGGTAAAPVGIPTPAAPATPDQVPAAGDKPRTPRQVRYVRLHLNFSRFGGSARARNRQKVLVLQVRARDRKGVFRNLRAVITDNSGEGKPYATGRLVRMQGRATLRLTRTRKFKKGRYVLVLTGRDPRGKFGRASARIRLS